MLVKIKSGVVGHEKLVNVMLVLAAIGLLCLAIVLATQAFLELTTNTPPPSSVCPCLSPSSRLPTDVCATSPSPSTEGRGYNSTYKRYRAAAVTTDTNICSQIGVLEHSFFTREC